MKIRDSARLAVLACGLVAALPLPARAESAREILDKAKAVNDARKAKDGQQKMKMTIVDAHGGRLVRELETYSRSYGEKTSKTVSFFLSPVDVKGVGFLAWAYPDKDDDQWLYLPELRRTRRITASARRQSLQGSDFSYQDIELLEKIQDWSEDDAASKLLKESEPVDGVACAVLELVPKNRDLEYGRLVVWLNREDSTVRKIDFHDVKDGALLKTLVAGDFRVVDRIPTAHRVEMSNAKKGSKTLVEVSDVRYNVGLEDDIFTERYLERGKVD